MLSDYMKAFTCWAYAHLQTKLHIPSSIHHNAHETLLEISHLHSKLPSDPNHHRLPPPSDRKQLAPSMPKVKLAHPHRPNAREINLPHPSLLPNKPQSSSIYVLKKSKMQVL